VPPRRFCR